MLTLPDFGFTYSAEKNRMKTEIVCDWLEGCLIFKQEEISETDVFDVLMENQLCKTETMANEIVNNVWNELKRRVRWTSKTYSIEVHRRFVTFTENWDEAIGHTFCLLLSLAPVYNWWKSSLFTGSYLDQGELFERLTKASLETQLGSKWNVFPTGWTRANPQTLPNIASDVANELNERLRGQPSWINNNSKELGLDLLICHNFTDNRAGIPVYMLQCASGNNWTEKRFTPKLGRWKKIIDFYSFPVRGMSIPFCITDDDFLASCLDIEGIFIERCRLLSARKINPDWIPNALRNDLIQWCKPRIDQLLSRSQ